MRKLAVYVIIVLTVDHALCNCPEGEPLKPCTCEVDPHGYLPHPRITCTDVTGAQLKEVFKKLEHLDDGEKHFHFLKLTGAGLDELLEQTFDDITIDHIQIIDAPNFKKMDTNAFKNTHTVLSTLYFANLPLLDVTNLFDILNKFRAIEMLYLENLDQLEEIPSMAFKTLRKLHELKISGTHLKKINEKAFWNLNSLSTLLITGTSLDKIEGNVFVFSHESQHTFSIALFDNKLLNCNSYTADTFTKAGRAVSLEFSSYHYADVHDRKQFNCLPEEVFRPFLEANEWNDVDLYELDFDCTNCKSAWIKGATQFHERLLSFKCEDGKEIDDPDIFKDC